MRGILSARSLLKISGEESRPFLQGLVTQDILHAGEGDAVFTALLTPQGKILFDFFLAPQGDGFFIDCDAGAAPSLLKRLVMYKLRAKVTVSAEAELAVAVGEMRDPVLAFPDPRNALLPARSIVKRADMPAADEAYDAKRLALGIPEFGKDFGGDETFLLDVNYDALNAVSYKKGCFVGQEVTSRMKRKGEIRKRTLIAAFDGAPPAKGAALMAGENSVGEILSGREGVALALLRVDRLKAAQESGAPLTADGREVQISFPAYLEQG
ncbi:MAG: folate-binding protein [Pseudomonadota bacterium]